MHTKIWNLRYDTWGASDIHNEHFARFTIFFIYHFSTDSVYYKNTLFIAASESTKPKVNSYCFDSTQVYMHNAQCTVTGITASNVVTRPFFNDLQCLHSACNNFNTSTSSCDYLIFRFFICFTVMCDECEWNKNWINKQLKSQNQQPTYDTIYKYIYQVYGQLVCWSKLHANDKRL